MGTSAGPRSLPGVGGRRWTAEVGANVSCTPSPHPRLAPAQPTLTSAAFIYFILQLSTSLGKGWALGLY